MAGSLIRRLQDFQYPPPMLVFTLVLLTYFVVTAGIAYDIINEPPAVGAVRDPETGRTKPQTFLPHRMNGQYIMEGLCGGMLYTLGGVGLVLLERAQNKSTDAIFRNLYRCLGAVLMVLSFLAIQSFMRIKMPGYMR